MEPAAAAAIEPELSELRWLAGLRELEPLEGLDVEVLARAQLLAEAEREMDEATPRSVLDARSRFLTMMGVAPRGFDLRTSVLTALSTRLIGLYTPGARRVLVAADVDASAALMTRYHELAHGLADQHFDLASRGEFTVDGADRLAAASALAEGDATSLMLDALAQVHDQPRAQIAAAFAIGVDEQAPIDGVPPVVARLLAAPYVDGLLFVETLRKHDGWTGVNEAWRDPPVTTTQILHPAKYAAREVPELVPIPAAPDHRCRLNYTDVLGEQAIRALLEEWNERALAASSAAGWNGDRLAMYDCPNGSWASLSIRYQDEAGAAAGARAFERGFLRAACNAEQGLGEPRVSLPSVAARGAAVDITLAPAAICDGDGRKSPTCSSCQWVESAP